MTCIENVLARALGGFVGLLALSPGLLAQTPLLTAVEAELAPVGPIPQGLFGQDVAIDGARAMTTGDGDVYFYELVGGTWVLEQMLELHLDGAMSIDLDGDRAVAGSPNEDFVYTLLRGPGGWAIEQLLQGSDTAIGDRFGHAVALDGDTLAAGAPFADSPGFMSDGAVYVFALGGGAWSEQQLLTGSSLQGWRRMGWSVDLEGDTLLAGADQQNAGGSATAGAVFVFERAGGVWSETQMLTHSHPGTSDHFGYSVALSGTNLVVGSQRHQDAGAGVVFRHDGSAWLEAAELIPGDASAYEWLGSDVAIDGGVIALGGRTALPEPLGRGVVFLFRGDAESWSQDRELASPSGAADFDGWGYSVALSGDRLLAGAQYYDDGALNTGLAFLVGFGDAPEVGARYCYGLACPCGNDDPAAGCANSTAAGGELLALGSPQVALEQLWMSAAGLLPGQPALLFAGTAQLNGGAGVPLGDGLRCAGGAVVRLGVRAPDGAGGALWGPELIDTGGWSAGDTRFFQVWYRDPAGGPCAAGFNLSNGVRVTFVP